MYLSTTVLAEKLLLCQFGDKKCLFLTLGPLISKLGTLEIKPCVFESRIQDMGAESYNWSHFLVNFY